MASQEGSSGQVLAGYAAAAEDLIDRFEALDTAQVFAPVLRFLPTAHCRMLDLGAGTGRDAAWFAGQGHEVTAVEPVAAFRRAGQVHHKALGLIWFADPLPELTEVLGQGAVYDLLVLNGVWHHLELGVRGEAMANLRRLCATGGRVILSVRNGPAPADRPGFGGFADVAIEQALVVGFTLTHRAAVGSIQPANIAAGVTWDWLVLEAV
nr:class I SAM-dependent methyltransferase [Amylibacter sp.]